MVPIYESVDKVTKPRSFILQAPEHFQLPSVGLGGVGLASIPNLPDELQNTRCQCILDVWLTLYLQFCVQTIKNVFCLDFLPPVITEEVEAVSRPGIVFLVLEVGVCESKTVMAMSIVFV